MVQGFEAFESSDYNSAGLYLTVSIFFLIVAGLHKKFLQQFVGGSVAFFILEAVTILYSAGHYKATGHHFVYFSLCAAAGFYVLFALASIRINRDRPRKRRSRSHKRRRSSGSASSSSVSDAMPNKVQATEKVS